jgi:hypothetical protein
VSGEPGEDSTTGAGGRGRELTALVRTDVDAAKRLLAALSVEDQVRTICQLPAERRSEALALTPDPRLVIPRMPELDLCATTVAAGPEGSGWLLEHASGDQIVACLDLDAWRGQVIDLGRLDTWLTGLADAGDATLLRTARALDPELLVLWARRDVQFFVRAGEDEDWPPDDTRTIDGEHYFRARRPDADLELLLRLLYVLFENDQTLYLALVHDLAAGASTLDEEEALRWRGGRLIDLGFPTRDEALAAYAWLDPERAGLPEAPSPAGRPENLPVDPARPLLPILSSTRSPCSPDGPSRAHRLHAAEQQGAGRRRLSLGGGPSREAMSRTAELASAASRRLPAQRARRRRRAPAVDGRASLPHGRELGGGRGRPAAVGCGRRSGIAPRGVARRRRRPRLPPFREWV